MTNIDYMGRGLIWPINVQGGLTQTTSGFQVILQSILRILLTPIGKIIFNPDFGSRVHELQFQPNDDILKNMLQFFIDEAITKWEKRVKFVGITFDVEDDKILCHISVRVLATNEVQTFVFPFYKKLVS